MNPQLLAMLQDERAAGQREGYARALRELHQELCSMGIDKAVPWAKTLTDGDTAEGSVCMAMALMWLHLERKMEDGSPVYQLADGSHWCYLHQCDAHECACASKYSF